MQYKLLVISEWSSHLWFESFDVVILSYLEKTAQISCGTRAGPGHKQTKMILWSPSTGPPATFEFLNKILISKLMNFSLKVFEHKILKNSKFLISSVSVLHFKKLTF